MKRHPAPTTEPPSSGRNQPTPKDLLIARQRRAVVLRARRFRRAGKTNVLAARLSGVSVPTLWRYEKKFDLAGLAGLVPRTALCGRKSCLARLRIPRWVLCRVEQIALGKGSGLAAAWRRFARSAECPPAIAARVRKGVPPSFMSATALRTVRVRVGKHLTAKESLAAALNKT